MHAELASGVRSSRDNPALVCFAAHYDGFAFQRRIEQFFDGDEEGIHVEVAD